MKTVQELAIAEAERWIGTPYRHQASGIGIGCDCLGLVRGIWRTVYGEDPSAGAVYSPDWAERGVEERLMRAAVLHCGAALPVGAMMPGDLLLFRWRREFAAKHIGLLSDEHHFIHAYEQAGVVRSSLVAGWRNRIAGVFRLPDIS